MAKVEEEMKGLFESTFPVDYPLPREYFGGDEIPSVSD